MNISVIAAVAEDGTIGKDNRLPWRIPDDLKRFKALTMGHAIVMGRRTFESIGKALPGRRNLVLTSNGFWSAPGAERCSSFSKAVASAQEAGESELFVIGGEEVYRAALGLADRLYLTEVKGRYGGDAFFPEFNRSDFKETSREEHAGPPPFAFTALKRLGSDRS